MQTVNNRKATYEKTAKDIKVKHTTQKDDMMKTVTDGVSKILDEKITEVDKVYDPACQKLFVQAEMISNYLQKVEKLLQRANDLLKNSKLQELMTACSHSNVPSLTTCSHSNALTTCSHSNVPSFTIKIAGQSSVILRTEQYLVLVICTSLTMPTLIKTHIVILVLHTNHQLGISMALHKPDRCLLVATTSHQQKLKHFIE